MTENWPSYIAATKQHLRVKHYICLASPIPALHMLSPPKSAMIHKTGLARQQTQSNQFP